MREIFLNNSLNLLCKTYNYDNDTLDKVKYGLEIIYISITKLTFLLICSIIFKTFKETLIFSFFISFIRNYSYGIHAKKSWQCYVSSFIVFIIFPFAVIKINLPFLFKIIICLFSLISMILYAPADTYKRPLVNKEHRKLLKIKSIIFVSIYSFIIFILNDKYYSNIICLALITQSMLINPFIYKLFKLPYNNYKAYQKGAA